MVFDVRDVQRLVTLGKNWLAVQATLLVEKEVCQLYLFYFDNFLTLKAANSKNGQNIAILAVLKKKWLILFYTFKNVALFFFMLKEETEWDIARKKKTILKNTFIPNFFKLILWVQHWDFLLIDINFFWKFDSGLFFDIVYHSAILAIGQTATHLSRSMQSRPLMLGQPTRPCLVC